MKTAVLPLLLAGAAAGAWAAEASVTLETVNASGSVAAIGSVRLVETPHGLVFYPDLKGLTPGLHGFHVHTTPSCAPAQKDGQSEPAGAAGGHLDPRGTQHHGEPWGEGHLGDLPPLYVAPDGRATQPVLAPRLKLADVRQHALMVHAGGDNHTDQPPAGGGGTRVACGVIGA